MKSTGTNLLESDPFLRSFKKQWLIAGNWFYPIPYSAVACLMDSMRKSGFQPWFIYNYTGNSILFRRNCFARKLAGFHPKSGKSDDSRNKKRPTEEHFSNDIEKRKETAQFYPADHLDERIREWGVEYAIDLQLNRDSGFYLDNALLRKWLIDHCEGKRVLNTFSYTGSLGMAALAGGAIRIVQTDLNEKFLNPIS